MRAWKQHIMVMLMLTVASGSFAHIVDPDSGFPFQYRANLAEVAPVVDGFLDDPAWEAAALGNMEWDTIENKRWAQNSDDFMGTFVAVWRNSFLYIAIKLTDDQVEIHEEKLSRQDHLEIYLDIDHSGYKSNFYHHILRAGEHNPDPSSPIIMVAWSDDGQSCELSVNLRQSPNKDDAIGFGIHYNDVDGGRLHHKIGWAPTASTEEDTLADLMFTAKLKLNTNLKAMQWGSIKSLY